MRNLSGFLDVIVLLGSLQGFILSALLHFSRRPTPSGRILGAAQSDTVFLLPGINPYPTIMEFIRENGKVTRFIVTQGGKYTWDRVSP
jgi:hypothetical protein